MVLCLSGTLKHLMGLRSRVRRSFRAPGTMVSTAGKPSGEIYNERSKGKDVRTSNIIAAKVGQNHACSVRGIDGTTDSSSLVDIVLSFSHNTFH